MAYKNPEDQKAALARWRKENPNYNKEWQANNRLKSNERMYKYARLNLEKKRARAKVYYALKTGKIIKPDTCSECGGHGEIQADHHDYSLPMDVRWLCRSCHQNVTDMRRK